jgi:Skp family chaperone for outer membrane proteins
MKNSLNIIALLVALTAVGLVLYKPVPKVAYIETPLLLDGFTEAIQARKQIEEKQKQWQKKADALSDSLNVIMDIMKKEYNKSSQKKKAALKKRFQTANDNFSEYKEQIQTFAPKEEQKIMKPVIDKVNSFLRIWGLKHGYTFVFGTTTGGNIVYADEMVNATKLVSLAINEHYKEIPTKK